MTEPNFIAWVTSHALITGILVGSAEVSSDNPHMITFFRHGTNTRLLAFGEGREWHRTPEAALLSAEEMRRKKIESLKKSIARIEAIEFVVPTNDGG